MSRSTRALTIRMSIALIVHVAKERSLLAFVEAHA